MNRSQRLPHLREARLGLRCELLEPRIALSNDAFNTFGSSPLPSELGTSGTVVGSFSTLSTVGSSSGLFQAIPAETFPTGTDQFPPETFPPTSDPSDPFPPDPFPSDPFPPDPFPPPVDPGNGSTDPLKVLATEPAGNTTLDRPPTTLTIVFDRPIVALPVMSGDILLDRIGEDGKANAVVDVYSNLTESLDTTHTRLTLTLNQTLKPGQYRILLSRFSMLTGANGERLASTEVDQSLAEFTVRKPGVTLDDATDLGQVGPTEIQKGDVLDFTVDPQAVALYKIVLTPDHTRWRLGLEVTAQRDGSPLNAALTLFDAQGHPLATAESGRATAPRDPFLFAGLAPGTYYVGVSGRNNLPDLPGGYDLVNGDPGVITQTQAGGPFTLHVAADPAETPPALLNFHLIHGDPLDPNPTGFSLQFSGPLALGDVDGELTHAASANVEVVDRHGVVWPLAGVQYDETEARVSYVFARPLPPGEYIIRVPGPGGLKDLSGLNLGSIGKTDGVLASFRVLPGEAAEKASNDLGVLRPDPQTRLEWDVDTAPDTASTYRFVVLFPAYYRLDAPSAGRGLGLRLDGPDGRVPLSTEARADAGALWYLTPGVYSLRVSGPRGVPLKTQLTLRVSTFRWESLLQNGVGQGPALNLRLIAPVASTTITPSPGAPSEGSSGSPTAPLPSSTPPVPAPPNTTPNSPGTTPSSSAGSDSTRSQPSAPTGQGGLFLSLGGQPVGQPSGPAATLTALGPQSGAMLAALTPVASDMPPSIGYGSSTATLARNNADLDGDGLAAPVPGTTPANAGMTAPELTDTDESQEQVASMTGVLRKILARLDELARSMIPVVSEMPTGTVAARAEAEADEVRASVVPGVVRELEETEGPRIHLVPMIAAGAAALMVVRYRETLSRLLRRKRQVTRGNVYPRGPRPHHSRRRSLSQMRELV